MKTLQAVGVGFGLAVGFAAACVAFVMCGAAASERASAAASPPSDTSIAGVAMFRDGQIVVCGIHEGPLAEITAAISKLGDDIVRLQAGQNCASFGRIVGQCTTRKSPTYTISTFAYGPGYAEACVQRGGVWINADGLDRLRSAR